MGSFHEYINEYQLQVEKGAIPRAYKGLMEYIMGLRTYLQNKHPGYYVSGSIYQGYMDMTYFSFTPRSLKQRNLRIAIVFIHEKIRFEAWLAGINKKVQSEYWKLLKQSGWGLYRIVPALKGSDSIVECALAECPDFSDLDGLTRQIEAASLKFIEDIEKFLSEHASQDRD